MENNSNDIHPHEVNKINLYITLSSCKILMFVSCMFISCSLCNLLSFLRLTGACFCLWLCVWTVGNSLTRVLVTRGSRAWTGIVNMHVLIF